ncbi:MAG: peptidylprolyl isomerase [Verrucomicrobiota bacterium]
MRLLAFFLAVLLGAVAGEWLARQRGEHEFAGRWNGRGPMIAFVSGLGVFAADLQGQTPEEFVATTRLREDGGGETSPAEVERISRALRGQFADEKQYRASLRSGSLTSEGLRAAISETLAGEQALEQQITNAASVSPAEVARYYSQHSEDFVLPLRLHLRHIFLAAPAGSAAEIVQAKEEAMTEILRKLRAGGDFATLAGAISEDESSRDRGGDLGWIAAARTPAEIFDAASRLPANAAPTLIRSHLGLHAVQVMESRPPRALSLAEATPEILATLSAGKRKTALLARQKLLAQAGGFIATAQKD